MNTKDRYAERIMDAYVLLMLCFFPLFTLRGYRDILKDRFKAFCILTGGAAVFLLLVFLYRFFFEGDFLYRRRAAKRGAKKEEKKPSPGPHGLRERISAFFPACRLFFEDLEKALRETGIVKKPLSTDLPMLLLIVVYLVSMLRSGYLYETFWGIWGAQEGKSGGGRCMGFLTWFMIFLAYFMLSRIYRAKLWHILLGLFTGILVCLWGITDFFKMNLFHFFDGVAPVYWETFASSVGNINSYTSLYGPSSEGGEDLAPPFLFRGHADLLYGLLHGKVRQRGPFLRGAFCPPPPLRLEVEGELPPLLGVDPRFPLLYVDAGLSHKERDDPSYRKYL